MNTFTSRLLCGALLAGSALSLHAMPANPVPRTFVQPDGSTLTLSQRGDERCSFYTTESGLIVRQDNAGWYRLVANDGSLSSLTPADLNMNASLANDFAPEQAYESIRKQADATLFSRTTRHGSATYAPSRIIPGGKYDNSDGHDLREVPTTGSPHVLIILVNFTDVKFSFCSDPHTEMVNMMTQPGYSNFDHNGSAFDFYRDQSRGLYTPQFDVYGPVQLPNSCSYYGTNSGGSDARAYEMIIDATRILDDQVDFSIYDTNGDGQVDNVYVIYAGYGENDGGGANTVWPHAWQLQYATTPPVLDGVTINRYACSNELNYPSYGAATPTGIGTFCHEFGHVLGQPDMYATTYSGAFSPGSFSAMDKGSYNNNGRTPPNFSAYERYAMEWIEPVVIDEPASISMLPIGDGGNVYKMTVDPSRPTEYFLFENRQLTGWDTYIPGHGMLIWHIDYNYAVWHQNVVNNNPDHQYVDIVEADNTQSDGSRNADPFPGARRVTEFTASTSPAFRTWTNKTSDMGITEITESAAGMISFNVGGGNTSGDLAVEAPRPRQVAGNTTSINLEWPAVEDAEGYIVSVFSQMLDPDYYDLVEESVPGYEFAEIADNSLTIEGLEPATTYICQVYAMTKKNLSPVGEGRFTTFADELSETVPTLSITADAETALAQWPDLPDASEYLLTVATRAEGAYSTVETVNFDNNKYPGEWIFTGTFDTRADYSGQATPSLRFNVQNASIISGIYDQDIAEIDFWARVNRQNARFNLDFYSVSENGTMYKIATVNNVAGNKTGTEVKVKDLPDGVRQWMCIYTFDTADLILNIDDIVVKARGTVTDTPVAGYNAKPVSGGTHTITGLQRSTPYVARLVARNAAGSSKPSQTILFTTLAQSGVENILSPVSGDAPVFVVISGVVHTDSAEPFSVYATDGRLLASDVRGSFTLPSRGIYIVRCGKHATTIAF